VLDINGELISEKRRCKYGLIFQGKLRYRGQITPELEVKKVSFKVSNNGGNEPRYLEILEGYYL
jgi:hypothetical protein